jgi:2-polyprenyl-3-methyl-5-hydroxy-6-metoxy-1,4-benzoquinol methylase
VQETVELARPTQSPSPTEVGADVQLIGRRRSVGDLPTHFAAISLDRVRDYWDRRPCNVRHSRAPLGSPEYFDEVDARRYFVEPHILAFADFDQWAGKRVLEIGCGIGTDTIRFARAGATVTAVDVSPRSLALAGRRAEIYGLEGQVQFYLADAERLADVVPPEPYDLVYSFGVIHHTPHPERVIEQIRRHYVHDRSQLKVMLYHRRSWKVFWILLTQGRGAVWRLDELVARNSEAQTGCPVTYTYSRVQAARLLSGFSVTDSVVDFIFPYRVSDYVRYRYVENWYFLLVPRRLFRALEQRLGWHLCITATPAPETSDRP